MKKPAKMKKAVKDVKKDAKLKDMPEKIEVKKTIKKKY